MGCLIFAVLATAGAQETIIRNVHDVATDTHVEVLALFTEPAPGGFLPLRVTVANNQNRDHSVRLTSEVSSIYSNGSQCAAEFTIRAEAGQVVVRDLLVPTLPGITSTSMGQSIMIRLGGSMGSGTHQIRSQWASSQPRVLLSARLHAFNASELDAAAASTIGGRGGRGSLTLTSRFDPKQLPSDWLAFGGYDRMLLSDEDWLDIPAGQRNAVLAWIRLGGVLEIHHLMDRFDRAALGLPDDPGFGNIEGHPISPALRLDAAAAVHRVTTSPHKTRGGWLAGEFDGGWALQSAFGYQDFRYGLFIVVLVAFGIIVGPVNLFLLAPAGRRHRLFVTTPVISLGASLLMGALIVAQDGMGGSGERLVLMEVRPDDGQNAAFIHQEQIARTGILTRTRFTLDTPALFHPVPIAESRWARFTNRYGSGGIHNLQPAGAGTVVAGDWFQSRSEQGHALSAVVPSRGRIERVAGGGYVSTFAHPLDRLLILDETDVWLHAENIRTGVRFTPQAIDTTAAIAMLDERPAAMFTPRLKFFYDRVKSRPGCFVALATEAPAIATHPGVSWRRTRTIITGPLSD